ncbi:DUF4388 domain-containing protein [Deinococcus sp. Leaf326]|uniref:DUF4388 domain-containing protein n=1 Tax=Deinococcus sp. Leaf326 TaxID=1736338 RepID=UPI000AC808DE|nr:DUF4388 domain-containing protein [Deinococcus sp. Leaf326]
MPSQKSSSLFLVADEQGRLSGHLSAQFAAAADWEIFTYACPAEAIRIDDQDAPNLAVVLCTRTDGTLPPDLIPLLEHAKHHWPLTFFVLGAEGPLPDVDVLFARFGEIPVVDLTDATSTRHIVEQEMANSHYGTVRGVPLPGFLQMMEWEHKTLGLRVTSGALLGRLHLLQGKLVNAYSHQSRKTGEEAVLELLAWDEVTITIERSHHNHQGVPMKPLSALLMEAMRLKDERERGDSPLAPDDFLLDDMEGSVFFRRPKSSTEGLPKPQQAAAPPATPPAAPSSPLPAAPASLVAPPPSAPLSSDSSSAPRHFSDHEVDMANVKETLNAATSSIDGAMAAALVDYESGMALGMAGSGVDLELAAAGNTEVVRAKMRTMDMLGIKGEIEDILITLQSQYHIIYIVPDRTLFLYLVLAKDKANLAMARYKLKSLVAALSIN